MLYSRAGDYPRGQPLLYAESFSPNTPEGACRSVTGSDRSAGHQAILVPDDTLTIRRARRGNLAGTWQGTKLRDIWRRQPDIDRQQQVQATTGSRYRRTPAVPVYRG